MKRKRYSEEQIISILKQHEARRSMVDLAREHGVVENTLDRWSAPDARARQSSRATRAAKQYCYGQRPGTDQ